MHINKRFSFRVGRLSARTFTSFCQLGLEELGMRNLVVAMGAIVADDDDYYNRSLDVVG